MCSPLSDQMLLRKTWNFFFLFLGWNLLKKVLQLVGQDWSIEFTLLGTNISLSKAVLKMSFLFPRWDMLIPWRVDFCITLSLYVTFSFYATGGMPCRGAGNHFCPRLDEWILVQASPPRRRCFLEVPRLGVWKNLQGIHTVHPQHGHSQVIFSKDRTYFSKFFFPHI